MAVTTAAGNTIKTEAQKRKELADAIQRDKDMKAIQEAEYAQKMEHINRQQTGAGKQQNAYSPTTNAFTEGTQGLTKDQINSQLSQLQQELNGGNLDPRRRQSLESQIYNLNRQLQSVGQEVPEWYKGSPVPKEEEYIMSIPTTQNADGSWNWQGITKSEVEKMAQLAGLTTNGQELTDAQARIAELEQQLAAGQGNGAGGEGQGAASLQDLLAQARSDGTLRQLLAQAGGPDAWKYGVSDETLAELARYQQGYKPSAETEAAMKELQDAMAAKPGEYQQSEQVRKALAYLQQLQGQRPGEYAESPDVIAAREALAALQGQKPGEYTESPEVIAAREALAALQGQKPQGFNSKYEQQLQELMGRIQNPEKFNYELNSDNLFKAYADYYNEMGRQANANAQGQAAALTGGYGNSYGESVGQQQNQQYLLSLNDKALELRDRAFQEYLQGIQNDKDMYSLLQSADATDYGRYRDTVGDWWRENEAAQQKLNNERSFDYGRYRDTVGDWWRENEAAQQNLNNERNFDYGRYQDQFNRWLSEMNMAQNNAIDLQNMDWNQYQGLYNMWLNEVGLKQDYANNERNFDLSNYQTMLNYWSGRQQIENQAWGSEADREEAIRQYDQNFAENQRQYNQNFAEGQRQFDANLEYGYAGLANQAAIAAGNNATSASIAAANRDAEMAQFEAQMAYKAAQDEYNRQQDALGWQYKYDQLGLQADEKEYQRGLDDRKYYSGLVSDMLALGNMPSDEMLKLAGLTSADAAMLMAAPAATGGGYGGYTNPGTTTPQAAGANGFIYGDSVGNYYTVDDYGNTKKVDKSSLTGNEYVLPAMDLAPGATFNLEDYLDVNEFGLHKPPKKK